MFFSTSCNLGMNSRFNWLLSILKVTISLLIFSKSNNWRSRRWQPANVGLGAGAPLPQLASPQVALGGGRSVASLLPRGSRTGGRVCYFGGVAGPDGPFCLGLGRPNSLGCGICRLGLMGSWGPIAGRRPDGGRDGKISFVNLQPGSSPS